MARFNRRCFLTGGGLAWGGLLLPSLLPILGARKVRAKSVTPIRRLVIMVSHHGTVRDQWAMRRGNPEYQNWEYDFDSSEPNSFSPILRGLHPYRQNLLVLEGLSQASTLGDRATNNHDSARQHLLTAARMVDDFNAGGPSVDQLVASAISRPDQLPSLELSTGSLGGSGSFVNNLSNQKVAPESNPSVVFSRLFPSSNSGASASEVIDPLAVARRGMLDLVAGEYSRLATRLSSEDRIKLEVHSDLLSGLSQRLAPQIRVDCATPQLVLGGRQNQVETGRTMGEITAAALACDLTRVVTLQVDQLTNAEFGAPPGDVHADFAHQTNTNPDAAHWMTEYNRRHSDIFAHLLGQLEAYPDGEGSLLDSTAVVWISELANGPHDLDKIPLVLAGRAGGALRTGRYLSYANDIPNPFQFPSWGAEVRRPIGPGHSHLWISLMQAMGMPNTDIGMRSVVTRDGNNTALDLTGPLARLG